MSFAELLDLFSLFCCFIFVLKAMSGCCICGNSFKIGFKIFKEHLGEPPIIIHDLVLQCIGSDCKLNKNKKICKKCYGKIKKFYKAQQQIQIIRKDLKELFKNATNNEENIESNASNSNDNSEKVVQSFLEIKLDDKQSSFRNWSPVLKKETSDDEFVDLPKELHSNEEDAIQIKDSQDMRKSDVIDSDETNYKITPLKKERRKKNRKKNSNCEQKKPKTTIKRLKAGYKSGSVCDQCGKTFHSYTGFIYHRRTHDPVKHFKCSICGESYRNKFRLKLHMAYHTGETPFECEICGKKFVHKIGLNKHKQTHDERSRRVECEQCGFKVRSKSHLLRHMITHTGARPFPCPVCEKCFATNYGMKLHLKEHQNPGSTRQQRYRCKMCPRTFTNKQNFEDHCERKECIQNVFNNQAVK